MKYDDTKWHYEGDFPQNLPKESSGTHIGMFLAWAINSGLVGEFHKRESEQDLVKLCTREITGRDFLFKNCGGKLTDEDLSDEGNSFASIYLEDDYISDYAAIVPDELETLYHLEDNWENYDKLRPIIDMKFHEWKKIIKRKD